MSMRPWLLIEDDQVDDLAFRRAAAQAGLTAPIITVASAEAALAQMGRSPRPRIIILDLNLPGRDGLDVLPELRTGGAPVVVLTTSRDERDRDRAHTGGAAGYFAKPLDRRAYQAVIDCLVRYWTLAEEPP